ncbi:MAG: hypothetical protein ABIR54_00475, partial [Burkholderiaceae bacterium]
MNSLQLDFHPRAERVSRPLAWASTGRRCKASLSSVNTCVSAGIARPGPIQAASVRTTTKP